MRPRPHTVFMCTVTTMCALVASLAVSASAGAAAWKFNGSLLEGTETVVGKALENRLEIPSLPTKCELTYKMTISNVAGVGRGEITELTLKNCSTISEACAVESAAVKKTPWPLHLATIGGENYVILEKVRFEFIYGGEECAVAETLITITGSAGGVFDNTNSTIAFNSLTFAETGTGLMAFGENVEWNCVLTTEATGIHKEQILEVG